ncbi:MAG: hypothetical protein E6J12_00885 [Chloroflexi bacterium]|nr:MAG: hypothetical protein E6J12_00885 [Chloroflexota bacterium]
MSIATTPIDDVKAATQRAFMELLEPELPRAYRLAYGMLRDQAEAEDAVQEAVLQAWKSFGRFRREAPLRPWLFHHLGQRVPRTASRGLVVGRSRLAARTGRGHRPSDRSRSRQL